MLEGSAWSAAGLGWTVSQYSETSSTVVARSDVNLTAAGPESPLLKRGMAGMVEGRRGAGNETVQVAIPRRIKTGNGEVARSER